MFRHTLGALIVGIAAMEEIIIEQTYPIIHMNFWPVPCSGAAGSPDQDSKQVSICWHTASMTPVAQVVAADGIQMPASDSREPLVGAGEP